MPAERNLPSAEAEEIVGLARSVAQERLAPRVAAAEEDAAFPRDAFRTLGELGFLGMPYPEEVGGTGQPYEVYLQALEEIAAAWASVGVGVSVHVMSCYPLATWGSAAQREKWLPEMLAGDLLGGYCLSEADAGSDPAAMRTRAARDEEATARGDAGDGEPPGTDAPGYRVSGSKAWVTHGGEADFYTLFARTSEDRSRGVSCFLVPGDAPGLTTQPPERKMGLTGSTTATLDYDAVPVAADRLIGGEGQGLPIALQALDSGRLGIAAVATGLAQGSLDAAVAYAKERETFGRPIIDHQGLGFLLADMAAAVESARAVTLEAARRRDRGLPFARQASIAKLVATDAAMKVTTDAVQVLGGFGYTKEFPVERHMREAKVMQIFEGTNQIQRLVIARHLARSG
ncbi:MAG TPA: acyl-CoA dehydrogenase family protein [Solirubrobacterales bacterium]|nr:acyl-CoA dehydrogenase family protein [Solirubrobacterales bacterium]